MLWCQSGKRRHRPKNFELLCLFEKTHRLKSFARQYYSERKIRMLRKNFVRLSYFQRMNYKLRNSERRCYSRKSCMLRKFELLC
jgi:hypothetical protein